MNRQLGFSLIEVLVTVFVMSIGVLGLAALQVTGIRNNIDSFYRSQATVLAYDMADRMRANIRGVTNLDYQSVSVPSDPGINCIDSFNTGTRCTTAEMADVDLFQWYESLIAQLPSAQAVVCVDTTDTDGDDAIDLDDSATYPTLGTLGAGFCDSGPALTAPVPNGTSYAIKIWWDESGDGAADQFVAVSFQP